MGIPPMEYGKIITMIYLKVKIRCLMQSSGLVIETNPVSRCLSRIFSRYSRRAPRLCTFHFRPFEFHQYFRVQSQSFLMADRLLLGGGSRRNPAVCRYGLPHYINIPCKVPGDLFFVLLVLSMTPQGLAASGLRENWTGCL